MLREQPHPAIPSSEVWRLAIPLFYKDAKYKFENCRKLTSLLTQSIKNQYQIYSVNKTEQKSIKLNIKIKKNVKKQLLPNYELSWMKIKSA